MLTIAVKLHCVKSVQIRSFFWFVFSSVLSEYRKVRTRKSSALGTFHAVLSIFHVHGSPGYASATLKPPPAFSKTIIFGKLDLSVILCYGKLCTDFHIKATDCHHIVSNTHHFIQISLRNP